MENDSSHPKSPLASKRGRESTGSGEKTHPTKKVKIVPKKSKEKSMYLMLITKGGYNFNHIPNDELLQIRAKMVKAIFEGPDPLIDWIKSVNGRALCACHTIEAVQWVKTFVKQLNSEYGAWLPKEGPNSCTLEVVIPPPTSYLPPETIIEKMKRTNKVQGNSLILFTKKISGDRRVIRFSADAELFGALKRMGFSVHIGIDRLRLLEEREFATPHTDPDPGDNDDAIMAANDERLEENEVRQGGNEAAHDNNEVLRDDDEVLRDATEALRDSDGVDMVDDVNHVFEGSAVPRGASNDGGTVPNGWLPRKHLPITFKIKREPEDTREAPMDGAKTDWNDLLSDSDDDVAPILDEYFEDF